VFSNGAITLVVDARGKAKAKGANIETEGNASVVRPLDTGCPKKRHESRAKIHTSIIATKISLSN